MDIELELPTSGYCDQSQLPLLPNSYEGTQFLMHQFLFLLRMLHAKVSYNNPKLESNDVIHDKPILHLDSNGVIHDEANLSWIRFKHWNKCVPPSINNQIVPQKRNLKSIWAKRKFWPPPVELTKWHLGRSFHQKKNEREVSC